MTILETDRLYLFSQFTEFNQPPDEILAELGYQLSIEFPSLPMADPVDCSALQTLLEWRIQLTPLTMESSPLGIFGNLPS